MYLAVPAWVLFVYLRSDMSAGSALNFIAVGWIFIGWWLAGELRKQLGTSVGRAQQPMPAAPLARMMVRAGLVTAAVGLVISVTH
jgi:hypothetical protein